MSPAQRASEFPGEHLIVPAGKLFCTACHECLVIKGSVDSSHIECIYKALREQVKTPGTEASERETNLVQAVQKYDAQTHRKGETLSDKLDVYWVKVIMAFLGSQP